MHVGGSKDSDLRAAKAQHQPKNLVAGWKISLSQQQLSKGRAWPQVNTGGPCNSNRARNGNSCIQAGRQIERAQRKREKGQSCVIGKATVLSVGCFCWPKVEVHVCCQTINIPFVISSMSRSQLSHPPATPRLVATIIYRLFHSVRSGSAPLFALVIFVLCCGSRKYLISNEYLVTATTRLTKLLASVKMCCTF